MFINIEVLLKVNLMKSQPMVISARGRGFLLLLAFPGRHCVNSDPYIPDYSQFIWDRFECLEGSPGGLAELGLVEQSTKCHRPGRWASAPSTCLLTEAGAKPV